MTGNRPVVAKAPVAAMRWVVARGQSIRWLADSRIEWLLLIVAVATVLRFAMTLAYEWRFFADAEQAQAVRLARLLQNTLRRDMASIADMLAGQALLMQSYRSRDVGAVELGAVLARMPAATALVRSLSLIDSQGQVLASSVPAHVGLVLELDRLVRKGSGRGLPERMEQLVAGRDIDVLARRNRDAQGNGLTFVPVLREVSLVNGEKLRLLAAVNFAYYDTNFMLSLREPWLDAAVLNMQGQVLAATPGLATHTGHAVPAHPFLKRYLPNLESGSYVGEGLRGNTVMTAMHAVPGYPLLVITESDQAAARDSELRPRLLLHSVGFVTSATALLGLYLFAKWQRRKRAAMARQVERSERERRAADELLVLTLENISELVVRTDVDGRLTYVNQRWETATGLSSTAVVGRFLRELVQPEDSTRVAAMFLPGPGASDPSLVRLRGRDGILRLDLSVASIEGPARQRIGYVAIAVDVTLRQKVRERLQDRLDFTLRLLEVSPTPVFAKNVDGLYTEVNRAFLQLLGLPVQQVLGQTEARLFPDDAMRHQAADAHVLRTGESVSYESQTDGPLGVRHLRLIKSLLCDSNAAPIGVVGSIVDVTLYRQAELALRQARDASVHAARQKLTFERSFLSMAAHELRTPLTSLRLQAEVMVSTSPVVSQRAHSMSLIDSVDRIGHVLEQLMILTRVDGLRESRPEMRRVDLQTTFLKVMADLQEETAQRRIQLRSRLRGCHVQGFEFGIHTLMRNLLHNAILYSPPAGIVSIVAYEDNDASVLSVDDSGPGIPPEQRERAFERFNRLGQQAVKGSGLGLSIVKTISDLHRATVSLEQSTLGGLRVVVRFPLTSMVPLPFQDSNLQTGDLAPGFASDQR